jgi:hypothetical protein
LLENRSIDPSFHSRVLAGCGQLIRDVSQVDGSSLLATSDANDIAFVEQIDEDGVGARFLADVRGIGPNLEILAGRSLSIRSP